MARILIADDEIAMREMLSMACRLDGHEVAQAVDTPTAVSTYASYQPHLMLLDLSMPGGGGLEVIHQLRAASMDGNSRITNRLGDQSPSSVSVRPPLTRKRPPNGAREAGTWRLYSSYFWGSRTVTSAMM